MNKFKDSEYFLPMIILAMVFCLDCAGVLFINNLKLSRRSQPLIANIQAGDQLAAVTSSGKGSILGSLLACAAPLVTVTTANTQTNPIIVPVPRSVCNNLLPNTPTPSNVGLSGSWSIAGGSFVGHDGKAYGVQAISRGEWIPYSADNRYPFGHYKFYFKDPSTSGSVTPSGSVSLQVVFAQLPRFVSSNYYKATQVIKDPANNNKPLGQATDGVYYVNYNQTPLIKFTYKPLIAGLFTGLKAKETIYGPSGTTPLYDKVVSINSAGNTISFTPSPVAQAGQVYLVRICPVTSTGARIGKAVCTMNSFITSKNLVF